MDNQRYMMRGVSAAKEDVHNAIKNIDKGIFPQAFCKIIPDILGGDPEYCNIMHADGAGTKSSLAYMYWRETGDLSVWKGIAQDALIMNTDDLLCVGAVDNILVSSTIGRNKNRHLWHRRRDSRCRRPRAYHHRRQYRHMPYASRRCNQ